MDILWDGTPSLEQLISHCILERNLQYDILGDDAAEYDMELEIRELQEKFDVDKHMEVALFWPPMEMPKGRHHNGK